MTNHRCSDRIANDRFPFSEWRELKSKGHPRCASIQDSWSTLPSMSPSIVTTSPLLAERENSCTFWWKVSLTASGLQSVDTRAGTPNALRFQGDSHLPYMNFKVLLLVAGCQLGSNHIVEPRPSHCKLHHRQQHQKSEHQHSQKEADENLREDQVGCQSDNRVVILNANLLDEGQIGGQALESTA